MLIIEIFKKVKNKNNINKIYNTSKSFADFSSNYFEYLSKIFKEIDSNSINTIEKDFNLLRLNKKKIFVIWPQQQSQWQMIWVLTY